MSGNIRENADRSPSGLSFKRARFVREYLLSFNASEAALKAGYSPKTVGSQGHRLLKNAEVSAAIQAGAGKRLNRLDITAERVLGEAARIAFSNISQVFDEHGDILLPHEIPEDAARAVSGIEVITRRTPGNEKEVEYVHKLKFWDKNRALELLGKHLRLFGDDAPAGQTVNVFVDSRERLAAAMARALDVPAGGSTRLPE